MKKTIIDQVEELRKNATDESMFWRILYSVCKGVKEGDLLELYACYGIPVVKQAVYRRDRKALSAAIHRKMKWMMPILLDEESKEHSSVEARLVSWFDFASQLDRRKLLKVWIKGNVGERRTACRKLYKHWDEALREDVEECYERTKEPLCLRLFTWHYDTELLMKNVDDLEKSTSYEWACSVVGKRHPEYVDKSRLKPWERIWVWARLGWKMEEEELVGNIVDSLQYNLELRSWVWDSVDEERSDYDAEVVDGLKWTIQGVERQWVTMEMYESLTMMGRMDLCRKLSELGKYTKQQYQDLGCEEMSKVSDLAEVAKGVIERVALALGDVQPRQYHLVGYNLEKVFSDKKWVAAYARVQALIEKKKNDAVYEKMAAENPSVRRLKEVLSGEDKDSIDEAIK